MPPIRSLAFKYCAYIVTLIPPLSVIMPIYSENYYEEENYLTVETMYLNT